MPPYARLQDEDEAPPPPPPPPPPEEELPSDASISVRLAHESARELEMRGRFQLAAEVLARALADEAQRINQGTLHNLDLTDETAAYQSRSVYHAMQAQRAHVQALHRRRLRHASPWQKRSGPALLQCCIAGVARGAGDEMPTPRRTLEDLASRWHLPPAQVEELWREFVEAREALPRGEVCLTDPTPRAAPRPTGGGRRVHAATRPRHCCRPAAEGWTVACDLPNTCPAGRAKATVLRHVAPEVQQATWSLVLLDAAANDLVDDSDGEGGAGGLNFEEPAAGRRPAPRPSASALRHAFRAAATVRPPPPASASASAGVARLPQLRGRLASPALGHLPGPGPQQAAGVAGSWCPSVGRRDARGAVSLPVGAVRPRRRHALAPHGLGPSQSPPPAPRPRSAVAQATASCRTTSCAPPCSCSARGSAGTTRTRRRAPERGVGRGCSWRRRPHARVAPLPQGWAAYVLDVVPHEPRGIRHKELFSALRDWSELRQLFSAREPSEALREAAPRAGEWTKNVFDLFRR